MTSTRAARAAGHADAMTAAARVYQQRGRRPIVRLREEIVAKPDSYLRSDSDLSANQK
jgi:hypothetical protein